MEPNPKPAVAATIRPMVADAFIKLGEAAELTGNNPQAAEYYRKAVEFDRSNAMAWICLADMQKKLGQGEEALASFQEAWVMVERGSPPPTLRARLLGLRGMIFSAQNRWAEAISDLEDAVELGNREWSILCGLLDAYWHTGQYQKSVLMIGFHTNLGWRVIDHLFHLEGQCDCCGRCCRGLFLIRNGDLIKTEASLEARWRTDPRSTRFRLIRLVGRRSFRQLPVPSEQIWKALLEQGYIDAAGATQVKYLRATALELPDVPLAPVELARIREIIEAEPILTGVDGAFLFHCTMLGEDNRCTDHEHRLALCREFPTACSLMPDGCGYHFRLSDEISQIEVPALFRLAGRYALKHGLHQEFLPHAREFLRKQAEHPDREDLAAIHELTAECCRRAGNELAARDHVEQAAALSAPRAGPAGGSPGNVPSPPPR